MKANAEAHAEGMRQHHLDGWRNILGEVHAQLLRELGFVDLNPGQCWSDGESRSFARCCSVGDLSEACWGDDGEEGPVRCCGSASRRGDFSPQLVASVAAQLGSASPKRPKPEDLIPAVSA